MKQLNQTLQSEWVSTASFFWPGALLSVWCFFSSDEHATVRFQPEKSSPDRIAMASPLRVVASAIENRTGTPMRRPNAELRTREYLMARSPGGLRRPRPTATAIATRPSANPPNCRYDKIRVGDQSADRRILGRCRARRASCAGRQGDRIKASAAGPEKLGRHSSEWVPDLSRSTRFLEPEPN